MAGAAGEIDTSGRLRATLKRNKLLLESARAGSEIARRDLIQAVTEAYFNLALATLRRRGAGSELLQPLSIPVFGWLLFALVLSLVVTPTMYAMMKKKSRVAK